jgi:hypothetical protein
MKATRHRHQILMRPEDVLACIRDSYRFAEELDPESEPGVDLTFDSTIDQWRSACDLLDAPQLGAALGDWFGVEVDAAEWDAVLKPAKQRRLRHVCELISRRGAQRPALRPFRIAGRECLEAAAFLTLRTALSDAGLPAAEVRPSTALANLASRHFGDFVRVSGKLAPGVLPVPPFRITWGTKTVIASILLMLLVPVVGNWWYSAIVGLIWLGGMVAVSWRGEREEPMVDFGEVRTFGDLARRIAAHHREQAI